jgi:membrane-bound serine protease (ClpP class)
MELVIIISAIAVALLIVELLAPTGGTLAVIGAAGFVTAGILALGEDSEVADYVGPGLITLGVLSLITVFIITPKVLRAHRDEPVRTGWEELIGKEAEVREPLDPSGQVWIEGALWRARVADGAPAIGLGNRVLIESVDGLTLVVKPVGGGTEPVQKGT